MSRRKNKTLGVAGEVYSLPVRTAYGRDQYAKMEVARRLKCPECRKTWKFNDRMLHKVCPKCKVGRLA